MKIYPGHGLKFASKDGKLHFFITSKVRSLYHQKIKPVKLTWTQAWRRFNKKVKVDEVQRKKTRKTTRFQKAVVGMSLEEIKKRRDEKADDRDATLAKTAQELKDRNLKKKKEKLETKKKEGQAKGKKGAADSAVKNVKAKV
jgi:large subunit ribosomal protein L24e